MREVSLPLRSLDRRQRHRVFAALTIASLLAGCGGAENTSYGGAAPPSRPPDDINTNNESPDPPPGSNNTQSPEQEEFLVRQVAATSSYVFVPNGAENSQTVARIDGRDYGVVPLRVGSKPTTVRAAEVEGQGAIAYVLCEGDGTLAIIRADELSADGKTRGQVSLLKLPREVNAIEMSPDGKHLLAYIDPDKPLLSDTSVASLQTLALVKLGEEAGQDELYQLSVTRLIRDIEFSADGARAFVVGREGINRLIFDEITRDAFIAPLRLDLIDELFPPEDYEVEVSPRADFLVVRSFNYAGVALFELTDEGLGRARLIELESPPTDIDLIMADAPAQPQLIVTSRDDNQVHLIGVDDALDAPSDEDVAFETIPVDLLSGLSQLTPNQEDILLYSTRSELPQLGILSLDDARLRVYPLLNQIRSIAVTPDSATAVILHERQVGGGDESNLTPQRAFRYTEGLTLVDLATGYRRPIELTGTPSDLVMAQNSADTSVLYVMLESSTPSARGVLRVDLASYRLDQISTPRAPTQIGVVADKVFVSQVAQEGRITFFDIDTNAQRTVSGYELNAGID